MASSSWCSVTNSPGSTGSSYDVFLSFRGEDTRHNFTDHLYERLMKAGIFTFRDEEDIKRGEGVKPEIEKAIKESRASIVVLSENYATSTWCLDELTLILQLRRESNHLVLPVFYKVEPCDVGKQNKTFAIEVKASSRWTDENVNMWKNALREVCVISGEVLSSSTPEAECLKKIVNTIYEKLDCKKFHLPNNLSGMAARYRDVSSIINDPNVNFVAICGMGGSGKTTLAKYIYNKNWNSSENMSFLEEVGGRCKGYDDLLQLQEKLLNEILGGKNRKIPSVSQGTCKIEEVLQTKKAFIVLDDIVDHSQLVTLLGSGMINAQSKIIITTRVLFTEELFKSSPWRCQKYKMRLLNDHESLELLYHHALGSKLPTLPTEGFKDLAIEAIHYCEGNPLALEVLGSSLSLDNSIQFWESTLSSLRKDSHDKIQHVLIGSYNSLQHQVNRELFLHIACFFVGKDKDYVEKILEPDFSAISGIQILCSRCLLSVSSDNKLMMHRLLQEMGKHIVRSENKNPGKRSRVWLSSDSYNILSNKKGSETVEGLALDMEMLRNENFPVRSWNLTTDALQKMDELKLLNLNSVYLEGSYEFVSGNLRWLCWLRCHLRTIPINLSMEKLVAIDLSYSNLEVFDPPMVLQSLKILNLKDSHKLYEIRNLIRIPHLETLVLWNCHELVHVGETIGDLKSLSLVNMTGCESLWREHTNTVAEQEASTSGGGVEKRPTFSFPHSLHQLFLKDCNLECTESFPLSFSAEISLQYLNLGNSLFEFLPCYDHLKNLRVLDLSFCARLKCLLCLPSTLAELYVYYCNSLEKITFQSHRFTLQEFGYEGCISLSEIEGFIKLVPLGKLEENDLGHLKWLKEFQNHEVCLVGDDELTIGRSSCVQMLYEFGIMSTSLPDIKGLNLKHDYLSEFASCSFDVPLDPKNRRLKGLDVTLKYTMSSDDDWAWFCKISTTNGVDLIYNPRVFGKPDSGKVGIWSSYWPIGNALHTGDTINVSVAVMSGLRVHECGVSLVYVDDKGAEETLENNMIGGDLTGFQLSTGAYYLCRRDFLQLMEFGRLIPDWFRILFGNTINVTEVRGWRKTGQPKQMNPSFTELKTIRCIIHGPELEDIYRIPAMSKASSVDKPLEATSSMLVETMKYDTSSGPVSFLEELKSGKGRRFELSDIFGSIVDFSVDQHGSRFIQQKLEVCSNAEKESVFKEVLPHTSKLMTDVFGNYVIQKFFEYGSGEQRRELGNQLQGQILPLSLQMYGCRVIQKALDAIDLEQKTKLIGELDGHVLKCVRDQNGNHVIQKCIESIPTDKIGFVISSFRGEVAALSKHPYGCRVIQRVLEHSTDKLHSQFIVDEILDSVYDLAQDQYGNYVTQYVLEGGKPEERSRIVQKLAGHIVQLSQHKFASNVIEKCLEYGDSGTREIMIEEIIGNGDGNDNLLVMVKDQFANYVVQKVLQTCSGTQREVLLGRIKIHLNSLKKYTYGKHIVARFEQLYGEEIEASGS